MKKKNMNVIQISMVEDQSSLIGILRRSLESVPDIELVSEYASAEAALRGLVKNPPDIVVMDIGLPQMNGIECMMRVRRKAPEITFLMFTVFSNNQNVFDSLKAGAMGYILKRDGVRGVIDGVRELASGGAPMSREIARKVLTSFQPPEELTEKLTPREEEILRMLAKGLLNKEIALELNPQISEGTVKQHIYRIYRKLQVNNRQEASNKYLGIQSDEEW